MGHKILFFLLIIQTTTLAIAQSFEDEYVPSEIEEEVISEDTYYAPTPGNEEFQAQEEQIVPEMESDEINSDTSDIPEENFGEY